jgi:hypothetical protein
MRTPKHTETPCGCAFHRGAATVVPPDCAHRSPKERAAYVASLTRGIVPPGAPVYMPEGYRPIHAYANGGRP